MAINMKSCPNVLVNVIKKLEKKARALARWVGSIFTSVGVAFARDVPSHSQRQQRSKRSELIL